MYSLSMHTYAAFLGHQPRLSIAELSAVLPSFSLLRIVDRSIAIFRTSSVLTQAEFNTLGGTVLLAEEISQSLSHRDVPKILTSAVEELSGKVTFALRGIGVPPRVLRDLYRACKDALKHAGHSSRYVGNERKPAATALLRDCGLLDGSEGREIVLINDKNFFWIGKTIAAQDLDAYTLRDMGKPVRDTRSGLLPPKLAQIMVNFGLFLLRDHRRNLPESITIFDPFCGTGVIPIEALLRNFHVLCSDKSEKAVSGCEKNLEWARKIGGVKKSIVKSETWKQDALKPFALKKRPDIIITETTLGPALTKRPTVKETQTFRSEAEKLEAAFLANAAATLPGVPVVLSLPVWYMRTGPLFLEKVWDAIAKVGYEPILPPDVSPEAGRISIVYRRADQFVGREIILLRPRRQ